MPRPRRTPLQTMAIAFALAIGLIVGVRMIGRLYAPKAAERAVAGRPDLEVIDATPAQLAAAGWRLDERSPRSWSDISVRLYEDDRGNITLLRCRVDAAEVPGLAAFPPDSRRPSENRAPADWPWGADGDPFRVPAWWSPAGAQSRLYESFPPDGLRRGVFANYDPASRWLHLWSWARNDVRPVRADALAHLVVDELATALSAAALAEQWPADAEGWFTREGLVPAACGVAASRLPAGLQRVDAQFLPLRGRHRYLLRLTGIDEPTARALVGETPLRTLPDDGPPPSARWSFALPNAHPPAWLAAGTGPRWTHCLLTIGPGAVERGRWAAYDRAARSLHVWDWEESTPRPAEADLVAHPP